MAFDLSTAKPVQSGGFDLSTAKPIPAQQQAEQFDLESFHPAGDIGQVAPTQKAQDPQKEQTIITLAQEFAAGANRPIFQLIDAFGTDTVNAAFQLAGSEKRLPGALETFGAEKGQFAGPGLGTEIAGTAGELATIGGVGGAVAKGAATFLPQASKLESALVGTTRQLGKTSAAGEAATGALSGAGQEAGREVGGEAGAVVGALAAPIGGIVAAKATIPAFKELFGRRAADLIDTAAGLPTPKFQKALVKKGITVGSDRKSRG